MSLKNDADLLRLYAGLCLYCCWQSREQLGGWQLEEGLGGVVPAGVWVGTTSVQNQWSHSKSTRMPGINRSNLHARGQKHCLWGCAGLWRVLWGRSQRLFSSPCRYLAAEGAVLSKTNGPTSAGLAPPGHRMARKRPQSTPLTETQALGRGQLLFMYRVSVGFFRWADFGFLARWSWFEPKTAYTHLLAQRKTPLLPFLASPLCPVLRGGCRAPPLVLHGVSTGNPQ